MGEKEKLSWATYLKKKIAFCIRAMNCLEFLKGKKRIDSVKQLIFLYFSKTWFIFMYWEAQYNFYTDFFTLNYAI